MSNIKVIVTAIKNRNAKSMNRSMIGFPVEKTFGPITKEDIIAYASATMDTNLCYMDDNPVAPPMYMSKFIFPITKEITTNKSLKMNILRMVHLSQRIEWHRPMKAGESVTMKTRIEDIYETPTGEVITITGAGFVHTEKVVEGDMSFFVRAKKRKGIKKIIPEEKREEHFRTEIQTKEGQQLEYARVSGDNNFIHTNNLLARMAGLPRTIMHGICVMAMYCSALTKVVADNDISRLSAISGEFSRPVFPGEHLVLVGYSPLKQKEIHFEVFNLKNKPVFRNGIFRVK